MDKKEQNKLRQQRYRDKKKALCVTAMSVTLKAKNVTRVTQLPALPVDDVLLCNNDIGWDDILALDREVIDEVYRVHKFCQDDALLRLRRAAGYKKRVAA